MSARKAAPSSSPASSPSAAAVAASSTASSGSLSTRDAILQRYAAAEGKQQSRAATAVGGKTMELFESGDGADQAFDNSHSTRSDRNLLLSSLGAAGAGGAKKGAAAGGAGVEDVDATTRVKPALAFQMFAGALYTGSGSVNGPSGGRDGSFETGPSSLLIAGSSRSTSDDAQSIRLKFESPFVKLQRLQDELKEFHVELKEAAATAPKGAAAGGEAQQAIWSSLSGNVQQLQGQLDAMMQQPQVKQMMQANAPDAAASSSSSLLPQFDSLFDQYVAELTRNPSFQPFPASSADSATASASSSSGELAVLPKLDERLNVLEKLLGTSAGAAGKQPSMPLLAFNSQQGSNASAQPITTTSVLPAPDLLTALSSLHAQLVQLNPQRLEFVSRACKQILIEQESIALSAKQSKEEAAGVSAASSPKTASSDKSAEGTDAAAAAAAKPYAAQVAHLYALTARWDTLALTLPTLIARLSSLHALHASSATLSSRVSSLERQSGAIDSALVAQKDGLQAVSKAAADNLAAIHANFKAMDERIKQLTKKMEQIK